MGVILSAGFVLWFMWRFLTASISHVNVIMRDRPGDDYAYSRDWLWFFWGLVPMFGLCVWVATRS